jgi:hypothetical protein
MAALPLNTTARLKVQYTGPYGSHTMVFRAPEGESEGGLVDDAHALAVLMAECQYDNVVWGPAEFAEAGSDLFFPEAGWVTVNGESGIAPGTSDAPSTFLNFGGRSAGGRRVKLYLFETFFDETADMKYDAGESALLDAVVAQLNDPLSEICAIDGLVTTWYTYVNVGQNDYITHRARRS